MLPVVRELVGDSIDAIFCFDGVNCFFDFSCCCVKLAAYDFIFCPAEVMVEFPAVVCCFIPFGVSFSDC